MQLHELIHSMTKAEKRHFKIYAQIGNKSDSVPKYIALFNILNAQSEYDEEVIKKKGFGSEIKNFLNEKILESLHVFHLRKSPDSELRLLLSQIAILFEKKLWNEMRKRLKKARQVAEENERFLVLLEILEWEQCLISKIKINQIEQLQNIISEKRIVQNKLVRDCEYEDFATKIYMLRSKAIWFNTPNSQQQFEQFIDTSLLSEDAVLPSQKAKIHYHQLHYLSSIYSNRIEKGEQHLKIIIDTANKNSFLFYMLDFAAFYVRTLFSYRTITSNSRKENIYETINNLPFKSLDITYTLRLESLKEYTRQLNKKEGELLLEQMEKEWNKYTLLGVKLCRFMSRASIFYSMFGDWDKAEKWLNIMFKLSRTGPVKDFLIFARLWQLVIGYEKLTDNLDKHIQNSYKYFNRHDCYRETERQIIQSFKGLYKAVDYKERKIIWQNLYDFLDVKIKDKNIAVQRGIPELQIWCKSKINQTTMAEVMRQNQS